MKISQNMPGLSQQNGFLAQHFCKFAEAGKRHSKPTNLTNLPLSLPNLLSFRKNKGVMS
jgi:hypothetical protein